MASTSPPTPLDGKNDTQLITSGTGERNDKYDITTVSYSELKGMVTKNLATATPKEDVVASADSVLQSLSAPIALFDPKYWKLLFRLYGKLPDPSPSEEQEDLDQARASSPSHTSLLSQEVAGTLAYFLAVQGCHPQSLPLWRRYLARISTDATCLLEALEALSSIPLSGAILLIGEYLKHATLSKLEPKLQERKQALESIVSQGADEDRISQWVGLPGELKALITTYIASTPANDETPFRAETEAPRLEQSKESAEVLTNIVNLCERARLLCRPHSLLIHHHPPSTILLHPNAYILQLGLTRALNAKRYFLARSLCLSLIHVLADSYREFITLRHSTSDPSLEPHEAFEGPRGVLHARLLSDLRLLIDTTLVHTDIGNTDNALLIATWVLECYGPDFGPLSAEDAAAAAKASLFDYMSSLPAPSPEVVRMIVWLEEVEHVNDMDKADEANEVCLRLCLEECVRLQESDPSMASTTAEFYDVIIHHEVSKLMRYQSLLHPTTNASSSSQPTSPLPTSEKVTQQEQKLRQIIEDALKTDAGKKKAQLPMLAMSAFAEVFHDSAASLSLGKKALETITDVEQTHLLEEHMARLKHFAAEKEQLALLNKVGTLTSDTLPSTSDASSAATTSKKRPRPEDGPASPIDESEPTAKQPRAFDPENDSAEATTENASTSDGTTPSTEGATTTTTTTTTTEPTVNIWIPRIHPPGLPQHDDSFRISANLVNALLPSQRALQDKPAPSSAIDPTAELDSLENAQKALLMRKKQGTAKATGVDTAAATTTSSGIKLPPTVTSALTPQQCTKLISLLEKGELHGFVKQLKASQEQVESGMEREKRVMEAVHSQRRLDLANRQRAQIIANVVPLNEQQLASVHAKNREEARLLEVTLAQQMAALEAKRAKERTEKLTNQQRVLQAFGVPGFIPTTDEKALELQRSILQIIQQESDRQLQKPGTSTSPAPGATSSPSTHPSTPSRGPSMPLASNLGPNLATTTASPAHYMRPSRPGPRPSWTPSHTFQPHAPAPTSPAGSVFSRQSAPFRSPPRPMPTYAARTDAPSHLPAPTGHPHMHPASRVPAAPAPAKYAAPQQPLPGASASPNRSNLQNHWAALRAHYANHYTPSAPNTHTSVNNHYRSPAPNYPHYMGNRTTAARPPSPTRYSAPAPSSAPPAAYNRPGAPSSTLQAYHQPHGATHHAPVPSQPSYPPPHYRPTPPAAHPSRPMSTADVYQDLQRQLAAVEQREASSRAQHRYSPAPPPGPTPPPQQPPQQPHHYAHHQYPAHSHHRPHQPQQQQQQPPSQPPYHPPHYGSQPHAPYYHQHQQPPHHAQHPPPHGYHGQQQPPHANQAYAPPGNPPTQQYPYPYRY